MNNRKWLQKAAPTMGSAMCISKEPLCREERTHSDRNRTVARLIIVAFLLAFASDAFAQAKVSSTAAIIDIPRAGVDINSASYFSSQSQANYFSNPGFEWPQFAQVIPIATATNKSFTSVHTVYWKEPSNFWNGANNCSIRVGTCSDGSNNYCWSNTATTTELGGCARGGTCNAGTVFGISGYDSAGHNNNFKQIFTCSGDCPKLVGPSVTSRNWLGNNADIVSCRVVVTNPGLWSKLSSNFGTWSPGWGTDDPNKVFVTAAKAYQGNSSLEVNAANGSASFVSGWDNGNAPNPSVCLVNPREICTRKSDCPNGDTCQLTGNGPFVNHPIHGSGWQFSFYALTSSTNVSCSATLGREGGIPDFTKEKFNIGSRSNGDDQWHQYTYTFTGRDTASTLGRLNFTMSCSNGIVYFDNMFLGQTEAVSGFTHDTYESLLDLNPGTIRMAPTDVSGGVPTATQLDGTSYLMPPMGQLGGLGIDSTAFSYGEMVGLAAALSPTTSPWLTVGMAWPDADYQTFGKQLCSWESSHHFPAIYVECDNEVWNTGSGTYFKTDNSELPAYGLACARAFNEMSSECSDSHIHYLLNNQTTNSGIMAGAQGSYDFPNTNQYGISDHFYIDSGSSSTSLPTIVQAAFANTLIKTAVGKNNKSSDVGQLCQGKYGTAPGCNQIVAWYEGGPQTSGTSTNHLAASQANVGWASAGIEMYTLLQMLTVPNVPQAGDVTNTFILNQNGFNGVDFWGITPGNWGLSSAFAPIYPWYRPAGLAIQLYNRAIRGDYHACTGAPSDVVCAAFLAGGNWTASLANANGTDTQVTITFPQGTVPSVGETINHVRGLADNNEATNTVTIGSLRGDVSVKGQEVSFTMPAFSAVALLQRGIPRLGSQTSSFSPPATNSSN
jgi:hypothetical protein